MVRQRGCVLCVMCYVCICVICLVLCVLCHVSCLMCLVCLLSAVVRQSMCCLLVRVYLLLPCARLHPLLRLALFVPPEMLFVAVCHWRRLGCRVWSIIANVLSRLSLPSHVFHWSRHVFDPLVTLLSPSRHLFDSRVTSFTPHFFGSSIF